MRGSWALAAVVLTACYRATPSAGAPCGPGDACPTGQECRAGFCFAIDTPADAELIVDDVGGEPDAVSLMPDAAPDAMPALGPWGVPTEITSLETADENEEDPSITADRLTVVLAATTSSGDPDIYIGTRTSTAMPFTTHLLSAVSSGDDDESPEISADGQTIYFVSERDGNGDVFMSTFTTSWSEPIVVSELSSPDDDGDVAISPDGLTAVVVAEGATSKFLFHTRASTAVPFSSTATMHTELHISDDVSAPTITNGAQTIYFHAGGNRDLYVAHRQPSGTYATPAPVTELNTSGRDASPFVLQSDRYIIFEREGDIYEATR